MAGNRTQIKIVGEILDTTMQEIDEQEGATVTPVSYTHLTLPTILLV